MTNKKKRLSRFRELYPNLSDEELKEAEENFRRFALLVAETCERLQHEREQ